MLCTIRYIKAAGSKDVPTEEGIIRMPVYLGTAFKVLNIGMFEDVTLDLDYVFVDQDKLADFEEMPVPAPVVVYKVTFNRPPFPEQILAGRPNNFSILVPIDKGEKLIAIFTPGSQEME